MCLNSSIMIAYNNFKSLEGIVKYRSCSIITAIDLAQSVKNGLCFQKNLNVSLEVQS
jgi:hypothetical protein